jgi:riboflavin synthase
MFTGIIRELGILESVERSPRRGSDSKLRIRLAKTPRGIKTGDSVAVNGVCLTVIGVKGRRVDFDIMGETMRRTNLGDLGRGSLLNIERSLRAGERMDGHFVLGHVDGVGVVSRTERLKDQVNIYVSLSKGLLRYVVPKGPIAIEGISLTVVSKEGGKILVSIIPHTMKATNLGSKKIGDMVNIETDILGKYVLSDPHR